ncbi:uncharacterized protein LOC142930062 [Petromyzon marinus]|uniref:uncharacterized protein LOC142930062 n=1 Tax=Petromyzon marinus TaxID=7757 RepID=UPI003F6F79E5
MVCVYGVCVWCVYGVCVVCVYGVCMVCVWCVWCVCVWCVCVWCVCGVCVYGVCVWCVCVWCVCVWCVYGVCVVCVYGVCMVCVWCVCVVCVCGVCVWCVCVWCVCVWCVYGVCLWCVCVVCVWCVYGVCMCMVCVVCVWCVYGVYGLYGVCGVCMVDVCVYGVCMVCVWCVCVYGVCVWCVCMCMVCVVCVWCVYGVCVYGVCIWCVWCVYGVCMCMVCMCMVCVVCVWCVYMVCVCVWCVCVWCVWCVYGVCMVCVWCVYGVCVWCVYVYGVCMCMVCVVCVWCVYVVCGVCDVCVWGAVLTPGTPRGQFAGDTPGQLCATFLPRDMGRVTPAPLAGWPRAPQVSTANHANRRRGRRTPQPHRHHGAREAMKKAWQKWGRKRALVRGRLGVQLPEASNLVRVFLSSTFSDMQTERDTLLDKAYPELQAFCQERGLTFEVVDMRWGVRDTVAVDHMTTELCLREIESCQKTSVGPTFVALLGNRYGYRPLPRTIPEAEMEALRGCASREETEQLEAWFWRDANAEPPLFLLQPITALLPHFDDQESEMDAGNFVASFGEAMAESR